MHAVESGRYLGTFLRGAAIGAAAMYLLDPDKGRRRRAIARDKFTRFTSDAGDLFAAAAHDLGNRARGAQAATARAFRGAPTRDDLQLIERVRSYIGRAVSNPHAIQVGARDGRVTLSGPVLASEVEELVDVARNVPGVRSVDNHLAVYREPGSIPSLQGTPRQRDRGSPLLDANGPLLRAATVGAGLALAALGATRGSLAGLALAGVGAGVAATGVRRPNPDARLRAEGEREAAAATTEARGEPIQQA